MPDLSIMITTKRHLFMCPVCVLRLQSSLDVEWICQIETAHVVEAVDFASLFSIASPSPSPLFDLTDRMRSCCFGVSPRRSEVDREASGEVSKQEATSNKCHASSNRCLTSSNKKLLGTSASLLVTSALHVVTRSY